MMYITGEIIKSDRGHYFEARSGAVYSDPWEPLHWKNIAATLAGNLRRAGYRVDGACVDADGIMKFWKERKPTYNNEKSWWNLYFYPSCDEDGAAIQIPVNTPNGVSWKDMIIEFPKDGE